MLPNYKPTVVIIAELTPSHCTPPPAEPCNVLFTSSATSSPTLAPIEHYASSARPTAGARLLTSSPSVVAVMPAPVPPALVRGLGAVLDFNVDRPSAGTRTTDTIAHDHLEREGETPLAVQTPSSDHEPLTTAGAHNTATHTPPPAALHLAGHADAGHAIVNLVLPEQDDTHKVRRQKA